ncbi:protein ARV 2-like [Spinacia oleracea]|uniref:Protein ARV n=1 Tax=Spinacia oleracea TaxID=3562 RepID=A0A9R0JVH3_SPIOL|nr:protein ARV 2-like [Spinacia oleracea]
MIFADEYIECELLILVIVLVLHKPQAYRHLLFNVLHRNNSDFDTLLFKASFFFLFVDAYKLWILNETSKELSVLSLLTLGLKTLGCSLIGNLVFFCVLFVFSRRFYTFIEDFSGFKDVLLTVVASSYLKIYMLSMLIWEFPASMVHIIDLFVMSSNLVALRVISESSFTKCVGLCLGAHAIKFFVNWMLK